MKEAIWEDSKSAKCVKQHLANIRYSPGSEPLSDSTMGRYKALIGIKERRKIYFDSEIKQFETIAMMLKKGATYNQIQERIRNNTST